MSRDLLIRNVPEHIDTWVTSGMNRTGLRQTEFLRGVLDQAYGQGYSPTLFDRLEPEVRILPESLPFRFIDLFAGIGGFRVALKKLGGECVFSCEYDKYARRTYGAWFSETGDRNFGDINELKENEIDTIVPDHDLLAAGFPCQPFSLAGVSKKNSLGHAHGFKCERQGNLFFRIADIVRIKRPPVLMLENVKNLSSHDKGRTWQVIRSTLEEELGYRVFSTIVDASHWVPQHRERFLVVCFDRKVFGSDMNFEFPDLPDGPKPVLASILESDPPAKYVLTDHLWKYLQNYAAKHKKKGNGFGFGLVGPDDRARTMSARYHKDGSEILIKAPKGGHRGMTGSGKSRTNPRRLTIKECSRLMGFTDEYAEIFNGTDGFQQVVSDTQAYRQFGNAVVPAMVEHAGRAVISTLAEHILHSGNGCLLKNGRRSNGHKKSTVRVAV